MNQTTLLHEIVFALGTFGLVLAFLWLALRKKRTPIETQSSQPLPEKTLQDVPVSRAGTSWWDALSKTRSRFLLGSDKLETAQLREALEEACLVSDLGIQNSAEALEALDWKSLSSLSPEQRENEAKNRLALLFSQWLEKASDKTSSTQWPQPSSQEPHVLWFVGVNGVGKTTSIAKLASELKARGHSVLLAAGDTFRAAAGEQLETWAQRLGIECVRGANGADSSSVLFDAIESAKAKKIDFVLCDSAGRLHNQSQLMEALAKNKRVMAKALPSAPHETLLVLDAHTGQNMLSQAQQFRESVGLTGLILTKMDGTARGGALIAVSRQLQIPIHRLGLGEGEKDFVGFDSQSFVKALLGLETLPTPPSKLKVISQEHMQSQ